MKKWNINYLLFSLMLLFGINLYSDEIYAATSWCPSSNPGCENDKVYRKIKCNYEINTSSKRTTAKNYSKTYYFYRKLDENIKDETLISYKIVDYSASDKVIKNGNKGNDYYKDVYACPKSIAYYDTLNEETSNIYYSQNKNGSDTWYKNKGTRTLTVYKLKDTEPVGKDKNDEKDRISLLNNCVFKSDSNDTLTFYTKFADYAPIINFYAKSDVPTHNIDTITIVGQYKNNAQAYEAIISGNCNHKELMYAYFNPTHYVKQIAGKTVNMKTGLIIFNSNGDLINNSDPNGILDYGYKNYILFKNNNLVSITKKGIDEAYNKVQECNSLMKKNCKSTDDDSEDCKKAKQVCYEAETVLNQNCSEPNKKLVNSDEQSKCDSSNSIITNYKNEGFTFEINVVVTCETLGGLKDKLQTYFTIIKILTPVLIIGLGVVDFIQATTSSDDDALKKAKDKFVKRLIIGVIIFLLPYLVDMILQLIDDYYQTSTCGIK